jgi:hypothetical protein
VPALLAARDTDRPLVTLYVNAHSSQYQLGASTITRAAGCTWTSGVNGVDAVTGGRNRPTPDQLHGLLDRSEEVAPTTPGWALPDVKRALGRYGMQFEDHTGEGWDALIAALDDNHYVLAQGDSDQFANTTCSGDFDGDHCIGIHPKKKVELGVTWRWIDDPICKTARWEREDVLRRYVEKLWSTVRFGMFTQRVPQIPKPAPKPPTPTLRYGARALAHPVAKTVRVRRGRQANVRSRPTRSARIVNRKARRSTFRAWQVTDHGGDVAGSHRWFGNRLGTRWVHSSAFRGGAS